MGQDRKDRQSSDAGLNPGAAGSFDAEIRAAVRYEKGLVVKAIAALLIVALVVIIRMLFLG